MEPILDHQLAAVIQGISDPSGSTGSSRVSRGLGVGKRFVPGAVSGRIRLP
jgi:hypothetical protein